MDVQTSPRRPVVYLVDDEPMLLDLNEQIMRGIGYDVRRFRSAELALEAYHAAPQPPELIITDYAMHMMTGLDLVGECRKRHPGQRILLVSGTIAASFLTHVPCKPDAFLAKPYLPSELVELVELVTGLER